jgi:hypothetical protein
MFTTNHKSKNKSVSNPEKKTDKIQKIDFSDNRSDPITQRMQYLWMLNPTGDSEFDDEIRLAKEHKKLTGENFLPKSISSPGVNQELLNLIEESGKKDVNPEVLNSISKEAHDATARDFSQKQQHYQVFLSNDLGLSPAQIMDHHQSAGYEFEFASFTEREPTKKYKEEEEIMPSHIVLSESENLSSVFNLPFRLETDSGNSLEVVTPPFLFLLSEIPKKILSTVFSKYTDASDEINDELISQTLPVDALGDILRSKDFGINWNPKRNNENLEAIPNAKHKQGAYGQINISMTSEDIVEFLTDLSTQQKKSGSSYYGDKSLSTRLLNEVDSLINKVYPGKDEKVPGGSLLYSRSVANLLAIPSIMLRQQNPGYHLKPNPNYATQIKESLGIWIKANPHEVILDYMKNIEDKVGFVDTICKSEGDIMALFEVYVGTNKGDIKRWIATMKKSEFEFESNDRMALIKTMPPGKGKIEAAQKYAQWKMETVKIVEGEIEELFTSWHQTSLDNIARELNQLNGLISLGENIKDESSTGFLGEEFGSGMGVRKDTYLPSTKGAKRKTYVSEIRGKNELDRYEDKLEK